ncbi:MAG: N-acyl homoserine lactonase family protein [Pseudomonadota bacterium]
METVRNLDPSRAPIASDAVQAIHAFSTGSAFQHKEHRTGSVLPQLWWVLTSRSWVGLPISVFLIEHKDGLVLFDTGLDPAITTDPDYISQAIGRLLLKRIFRFEIGPGDKLGHRLDAHGFDPRKVRKAVISHLHFDHVGGISDIPQADLLVSEDEWAQLSEPHPEREWILREHIEAEGAQWTPIRFQPTEDPQFKTFGGAFDIMGDGSLILLPTPGHTPGSMSLLVRSSSGPPTLLVGDLVYCADAIMEDRVPGTGDPKQLRKTYAKVRRLKEAMPDLLIIPSHDDAAIAALRAAWTLLPSEGKEAANG